MLPRSDSYPDRRRPPAAGPLSLSRKDPSRYDHRRACSPIRHRRYTHARNHVLAVLAATGEVIDTAQFPTTAAGMARAISWATRRTGGDQSALWVIEGVASYGVRDTFRKAGF